MNFWGYIVLVEILPVLLWVAGAICDNKASKFPNIKMGYRSKFAIKNKLTWQYANKSFAQIAGAIGTFLFVLNVIIVLNFGIDGVKFIVISNLASIVLTIFIVEKTLKKKFNFEGKLKNN